jgi:hypothetical protein
MTASVEIITTTTTSYTRVSRNCKYWCSWKYFVMFWTLIAGSWHWIPRQLQAFYVICSRQGPDKHPADPNTVSKLRIRSFPWTFVTKHFLFSVCVAPVPVSPLLTGIIINQLLTYRFCLAVQYQIIGDKATVKFASKVAVQRRFKHTQDEVWLVADKVALRQVFLGVLRVPPWEYKFTIALHSLIHLPTTLYSLINR